MPSAVSNYPWETVIPRRQTVWLLLAMIAAASMWFYVNAILRAHQIADAAARQIPRGNLSDLYPRWLGTRELLLRHRNPYSREVTLAIQEGYYGRRLDPSRPNDPQDQQAFAYPVYVVFLLAPLIGVPFPVLQIVFYWLLAALTALSVWLWLRALRWRISLLALAIVIVLALGSFPAVQGIKLQQLSLLVAALLAASAACVARGSLLCAGALLAVATIKPQLALPLVVWLLLWAASDWRARRQLVVGFALVMVVLLGGAEIVLPGWRRLFIAAIRDYHRYTHNQSILEQFVPAAWAARTLAAAAALACAIFAWESRCDSAGEERFSRATAAVMALTVLIVPMYAPYNQLLLLPAILALVSDWRDLLARAPAHRIVAFAAMLALVWPWIASLGLSAAYFLRSPEWAMSRWQWPLWTTFYLPVLVFALALLNLRHHGHAFDARP